MVRVSLHIMRKQILKMARHHLKMARHHLLALPSLALISLFFTFCFQKANKVQELPNPSNEIKKRTK